MRSTSASKSAVSTPLSTDTKPESPKVETGNPVHQMIASAENRLVGPLVPITNSDVAKLPVPERILIIVGLSVLGWGVVGALVAICRTMA